MRLSTAAALVGVVAGVCNIWEYFQVCRSLMCPAGAFPPAVPTGVSGTVVLGLAVVLVLFSLAEFLAPPTLFYISAVIAAAIDVIEVLNYSSIGTGSFVITFILVTLSVALSIVSATRKTGVSEQANPMNLPVFG